MTHILPPSLMIDVVSRLIKLVLYLLTEFLIVYLVIVGTLLIGAQLLRKFILQVTHGLDSLVGSLQGGDKVLFRHLFHLAFHHRSEEHTSELQSRQYLVCR